MLITFSVLFTHIRAEPGRVGDRHILQMKLHTDAQRIKSIGSVRSVLEFVFFSLSLFLSPFILLIHINASRLDRQQQGLIIITVDQYLVVGTAHEHTINQLTFHIMRQSPANINLIDIPATLRDLGTDKRIEILILADCIAITYEGMIKEENQIFLFVILLVFTEIIAQSL